MFEAHSPVNPVGGGGAKQNLHKGFSFTTAPIWGPGICKKDSEMASRATTLLSLLVLMLLTYYFCYYCLLMLLLLPPLLLLILLLLLLLLRLTLLLQLYRSYKTTIMGNETSYTRHGKEGFLCGNQT